MPHLYEQRIKELFLEALGILMENREENIGDSRAVSREKEVTGGLIQRLVDENATRKLDQHGVQKH